MSTARVILGILVVGADVYVIMKGVKKFERRRLMVVGEMEGAGEGHVFWLGLFFAFVASLLVLGG